MFDLCFYVLYTFIIYSFCREGFLLVRKKHLSLSPLNLMFLISLLQIFIMTLVQQDEYNMYLGAYFLNFLFFFTINSFLYFFKAKKILISIFSLLLFIYDTVQRYVFLFKGATFTIDDLSAIKTALSVAGKYDYTPTSGMILGFIFLIITFIAINKIEVREFNFKKSLIITIFSSILLFSILSSFWIERSNVEKLGGLSIYSRAGTLSNYGPILDLYINYLYSKFEYPYDYDEFKISKELNNIEEVQELPNDSAVNVICILSESLYDLSLVKKDINPSEDYLSVFNELKENTITGYTNVSVFGGGTANSEYEFLMNGNMAFLPYSSYPFTKYINEKSSSIASRLKDLGYKTIAYHPYKKDSWNREQVYNLIGFDEYYAYLDLFDEDTENHLIRNLLSDGKNLNNLIKLYEQKNEGERLFLYDVTIQNHGGFSYPEINSVKDLNGDNPDLNTYLTLVKKSDEALKEFIRYFDNIDEPTIICVFGDHIPSGLFDDKQNNYNDLSELLNYYRAPFLIHANYDIDEDFYENISLTYLSTLVMDYANLPKSKEQIFVQSFMDKYPILNKFVYGKDINNLNSTDELNNNEIKFLRDFCYYELSPKKKNSK